MGSQQGSHLTQWPLTTFVGTSDGQVPLSTRTKVCFCLAQHRNWNFLNLFHSSTFPFVFPKSWMSFVSIRSDDFFWTWVFSCQFSNRLRLLPVLLSTLQTRKIGNPQVAGAGNIESRWVFPLFLLNFISALTAGQEAHRCLLIWRRVCSDFSLEIYPTQKNLHRHEHTKQPDRQ